MRSYIFNNIILNVFLLFLDAVRSEHYRANRIHANSLEGFVTSPFWRNPEDGETADLGSLDYLRADDLSSEPDCLPNHKSCFVNETYRRIDGFCNNLESNHFGSSHTRLSRLTFPVYDHGVMRLKSVDGGLLPNPRFVSNNMKHMKRGPKSDVNVLWLIFGQFVDHDLVLVSDGRDNRASLDCSSCDSWKTNAECAPIPISRNDPEFKNIRPNGDPFCLSFSRSSAESESYNGSPSLEQINSNTAYLDLSVVYGSNGCVEESLRSYHSGLLAEVLYKEGHKGMMPLHYKEPTRECRNFNGKCTMAGDSRNGEHIGVALFHILFLREHNRIARKLKELNKHWDDETLYQESRKLNIAQYQHMVYDEFLPILLGKRLMNIYKLNVGSGRTYYQSYEPATTAQILSEFSTAAFRFGHTLIPDHFVKMNKFYLPTESLSLKDIFRNLSFIYEDGSLEDVVRGLAATRIESFDPVVEQSVVDKLFIKNSDQFSALDLVALNIARGRDHGLAGYTKYRRICGLKAIETWRDLHVHELHLKQLQKSYSNVHDIDLFVGGLIESPVEDGLIGPTFSCIIATQFQRLRNGDRFWFENEANKLRLDQIGEIKATSSLARIISYNVDDMIYLPTNVFNLPDKLRNPLMSSKYIKDLNFDLWKAAQHYTESVCQYKGKKYRLHFPIYISPCLRCYCNHDNKIFCSELYDACNKYVENMDENCKIACGSYSTPRN